MNGLEILAVTCSGATKNVGDSATLRITIRNNGQTVLAPGLYITEQLINSTTGQISGTGSFTTTTAIPIGGTLAVDFILGPIVVDLCGYTYNVVSDVYDSASRLTHMATATCNGLLIVNPCVPSVEITQMQVM